MEQKTKIKAEDGKQELLITRIFDLPLDLLFKAFMKLELIEQWMGNKVLKMENKAHGNYQFETKEIKGNIVFRANGSIHKIIHNQNIIRTFEMESMNFPVQLEFLDFKSINDKLSKLDMKIIFKSVSDRDNLLKLPFEKGINMAHNQLEKAIKRIK